MSTSSPTRLNEGDSLTVMDKDEDRVLLVDDDTHKYELPIGSRRQIAITGYSTEDDGLLILTHQTPTEVATDYGLAQHELNIEDESGDTTDRVFWARPDVTEEQIRKNYRHGDTGLGVWEIWSQEVKPDTNLHEAVCW